MIGKGTHIIFTALKKYAVFSGRAQRKEYWLFYLLFFIFYIVGLMIDIEGGTFDPLLGMGTVTTIIVLAFLIPGLTVSIRRLHDTDRSAWWLLIGLIPLAGLVLIVFFCLDGSPGENRFGPSPKEVVPEATD